MNSKDIYTNGIYLANNPDWGIKDAQWKADIITGLMKKNNIEPSEIIDVGCGAGGILQCLATQMIKSTKFYGYDISPQAVGIAKKFETGNVEYYNEDFLDKDVRTELLLIIDVLEHVDDYYSFLKDLRSKSDHFIFHIPLDLACRTILKPHVLLQQRNAVGHLHYFSKEMVLWALKDTGYTVMDWVYTKPIIDVDPPGTFKRRVQKALRNISFSINKDLSSKLWGGYSLMILAK